MAQIAEEQELSLGELALTYEAKLLGLSEAEVTEEALRRYDIMVRSVELGLDPGFAGLQLLPACAGDEERFATHNERAAEYVAQGDLESALLELRNALAIEPKNAETNFRIAEVLRARGNYGAALFYYHEARLLDARQYQHAVGREAMRR